MKDFPNDGRIGFAVRRDIIHRVFDGKKVFKSAIKRAETGPSGEDQRRIDVEEQQLHLRYCTSCNGSLKPPV